MDLVTKLKSVGTLSQQDRVYRYIDTGMFALNYVISGKYDGGIPVPGITQFIGESSTGKSAFATIILGKAQQAGFHCLYEDAENTMNVEFARTLGMDPDRLLYNNPESIEETFDHMEKVIKEIRSMDTETPIVAVVDSLAVLCAKKELEEAGYDQSPVDGALRAKLLGGALRKFDKIVKKNNVGLVVINQVRSKINVMYGDPTTAAAGGRSLEFYLSVNLKTKSGKNDFIVKDNRKIGIEGSIVNTKNKVFTPFKECEFKLFFDQGFDPYEGLLPSLEEAGFVTKNGAWYSTPSGAKFQKGNFVELLLSDEPKLDDIRNLLGSVKNNGASAL